MSDHQAIPRDLTMPNHNTPRLCFIGFGEAGQAIASGLLDTGIETIAATSTSSGSGYRPAPEYDAFNGSGLS